MLSCSQSVCISLIYFLVSTDYLLYMYVSLSVMQCFISLEVCRRYIHYQFDILAYHCWISLI